MAMERQKCEGGVDPPSPSTSTDPPRIESGPSRPLGTRRGRDSPREYLDNGLLSHTPYRWPVRSVERLPPQPYEAQESSSDHRKRVRASYPRIGIIP